MHFGTSLLIPIPKYEEESLIVKNMAEKESYGYELDYKSKKKVKEYPNGEEDSYLMSESSDSRRSRFNIEDEKDLIDEEAKQHAEIAYLEAAELIKKYPEKSPIFMIGMKRRVYWTIMICMSSLLGIFLNLGYNGIFMNNFLVMIPVFLFAGRSD